MGQAGIIPDPGYVQPNHFGNGSKVSPGGSGQSLCPRATIKPTMCDPKHRSVNIDAPCGSITDYYYYSPWRAPGSAPVLDPCGAAGGRKPGQGNGGAGAAYANTTNARLGDLGTSLPPRPSGTVWAAGSTVEVAFTNAAFHGGGYSYRICPAHTVTEACFQQHPLQFEGQSSLRWGGEGGERLYFNATYVTHGTQPPGSMWARHPIPRGPWGWGRTGASHPPVCQETEECLRLGRRPSPAQCRKDPSTAGCVIPRATANTTHGGCRCSDDGAPSGPVNVEVVDTLRIPADIAAGAWVLGWRWDAEESSQVWASCSDVTISVGKPEAL